MNAKQAMKKAQKLAQQEANQKTEDMSFAFEPNMQDDRFMFLPEAVGHQGMGICVSTVKK